MGSDGRLRWIGGAVAATAIAALAMLLRSLANDKTDDSGARHGPSPIRQPQFFVNNEGLWLFTRRWIVAEPLAVVFMCHGLHEHVGRYEHVARVLNAAGISVYGMDMQGHGQSDGTPGYVERFDNYVSDFLQFIELSLGSLNPLQANSPVFLLGHSLGGLVAAHAALKKPGQFKGVILSAPGFAPDPKAVSSTQISIAKILSVHLPKLQVGSLSIDDICSCSSVVHRAMLDKLHFRGAIYARTAAELLSEMQFIRNNANEFSLPVLLFYGSNDKIVLVDAIDDWSANITSLDKTVKKYPKLYHETMFEEDGGLVLTDITAWITDRI